MEDFGKGHPHLVARIVAELAILEDGAPPFACVAAKLGMSHRTLRRRLRAEGTSYSKILAEVRLEAALTCLTNDSITIDEIAYQLGYTEPTNFRHAFRRWTGNPPSAYRWAKRPLESTQHCTRPAHASSEPHPRSLIAPVT